MDPLQGIIGIKLTHLLAGVAGGVVRALLAGGSWLAAISSVVVGSLTAGYLTAPIYAGAKTWLPVIGHDVSSEHAISFLVGLTAMLICEGVLCRSDAGQHERSAAHVRAGLKIVQPTEI